MLLKPLYLLLAMGLASALRAASSSRKKPPHVVFILADDLGWNDVGYQNTLEQRVIETPHIDALAAQGVKLSHYYVQSVCSPTRSVLLTGKYQIHTGLQHSIIQSGQPRALGTEHTTIPEKLKTLGYATHMVGKWHLGYYKREFTPTHRGFDTFFGYWNGAENYYSHTGKCEFPGWECEGPTGCWGYDFYDGDEPYDPSKEAGPRYSTDLLTSRATAIIRDHDPDTPLFLYLPYQAVHGPLEAPQDLVKGRFAHVQDRARRVYAAMVYKLDEGVGNVTAALKRAGLYDDTVIIFSTDNGGDVHFGANNWPLRGWKGSFWEGGIRGVGFVHSPLLQEAGVTRHGLLHAADWYPTIVEGLAGGRLEEGEAIDGVNQWPHLSEGAASRRGEILHIIDPIGLEQDPIGGTRQAAIRVGAYKLLMGAPGQWTGHDGWVPPPLVKEEGDEEECEGAAMEDERTDSEVKALLTRGNVSSITNMQGMDAVPGRALPSTDGHGPSCHGSTAATRLPAYCDHCVFTSENLTTGICLFNIELDPLEKCNLARARPDLVAQLLHRLEEFNATAVPATYPPPSQLCDPALTQNRFVPWGDGFDSSM